MSQVRRRRALRSSVLAASLAVLASLVVAPPASADDTPQVPSTTSAPSTSTPTASDPTASDPTASDPTASDPTASDPTASDPTAPETGSSTGDATPVPGPSSTTPTPTGDDPGGPTPPITEDPDAPAPGSVVVGELVQAWPDPTGEEHEHQSAESGSTEHDGEEQDGPLSWIDPGDGGAAVRVPTDSLPDVAVGSTIAVTVGDQVADEASTDQGLAPAVEVQAATVLDAAAADPTTAAAGSTPTNTVTAVLVQPAGTTRDGMTMASMLSTLNGSVFDFWDEQSNGTVRIQAVAGSSGWVTSAAGCDKPFDLWNDVARQIGWSDDPGKHLMLYVPADASGCAYGLGTVGSSVGSGGLSYVRAVKLSVMGHELGHNFGLGHSSKVQCDGTLETGTCRTVDYADYYDIMGFSWDQVGTLNTAQAARLGMLPASEQVALTPASAPTAVALAPVAAASGTRTIKLTAVDGSVYYVEYRQASGRDAWLGDDRRQNRAYSGVVLRRALPGNNTSLLLDGTPSRTSGWGTDTQQALAAGTTMSVGRTFTLTVTGTDSAGARVQVGSASTFYLNNGYSGTATTVFGFGSSLDDVFVGDWNGDGTDTIMVRRGNQFSIRNSNTSGAPDVVFSYGDPGDRIVVGDWDGDGRTSLAVRRGNTFFVTDGLTSGTASRVITYGDVGDEVLVGDWDGNGTDTFAVRRVSSFLVRNTVTTGVADLTFTYGNPGDDVYIGRWSSAQRGDTVAVRRGITYYLRYSNSSGTADRTFAYGNPSDTALFGDWDADGVQTVGIRRTD